MTRALIKGAHVFIQGEPADFFYKIISGRVCTYRLLNTGRRLINAFCGPGDIVGLDPCEKHRLSALTMSEATVIAFQRRRLDMRPASEATLSQEEIISSLMRSLERAENHALLLRYSSSKERVSAFLLEVAERTFKRDNFKLRHTDIADYLGLSRETVSRALARLAPKRDAFREVWPCTSDPGRRRGLVDMPDKGAIELQKSALPDSDETGGRQRGRNIPTAPQPPSRDKPPAEASPMSAGLLSS
jgi:CRP/FNR family nitrogen fixation transcriptional regulator